MKKLILLFVLGTVLSPLRAQETYTFTLDEAIAFALKNNYTVKTAALDIDAAELRTARPALGESIDGVFLDLPRVAKDPTQPNLRQVHLIHAELFAELREKGYTVKPGELGENITTAGVDLLDFFNR